MLEIGFSFRVSGLRFSGCFHVPLSICRSIHSSFDLLFLNLLDPLLRPLW